MNPDRMKSPTPAKRSRSEVEEENERKFTNSAPSRVDGIHSNPNYRARSNAEQMMKALLMMNLVLRYPPQHPRKRKESSHMKDSILLPYQRRAATSSP